MFRSGIILVQKFNYESKLKTMAFYQNFNLKLIYEQEN